MSAPKDMRRRRLRLLAIPAVVALVTGLILGASSGDSGSGGSADSSPSGLAEVSSEALIGARFMVRMDGVATPSLLRSAKQGEIGGVIVFPSESLGPAEVGRQIRKLQRAAQSGGQAPLLVATDQEGGEVRRFPDSPPSSSAEQLGRSDPNIVGAAGRATGEFLAGIGINIDLAPVLDLGFPDSFIGSRSFGAEPVAVGGLGAAFVDGLAEAGVMGTAKHFPGLGRAIGNTDFGVETLPESAVELETDLTPFRAAIDTGVPLVMLASATFNAYDAKNPAVFSKAVVGGLLRDQLGFEGVTITDDLHADAIAAVEDPGPAALRAAVAGVDVLLFAKPGGLNEARRALARGLANGRLDRDDLERSYGRILSLRNTATTGTQG